MLPLLIGGNEQLWKAIPSSLGIVSPNLQRSKGNHQPYVFVMISCDILIPWVDYHCNNFPLLTFFYSTVASKKKKHMGETSSETRNMMLFFGFFGIFMGVSWGFSHHSSDTSLIIHRPAGPAPRRMAAVAGGRQHRGPRCSLHDPVYSWYLTSNIHEYLSMNRRIANNTSIYIYSNMLIILPFTIHTTMVNIMKLMMAIIGYKIAI